MSKHSFQLSDQEYRSLLLGLVLNNAATLEVLVTAVARLSIGMQTLLKDVAHLEEDELAELAERYESLASFMAKSSEQIKKKHLENLSTVFGGMPDELRRQIDEALHRPPSS